MQQIKTLIAEGNIEKALIYAEKNAELKNALNDILLLKARYHRIHREFVQGLIGKDQELVEVKKIIFAETKNT